MLPHVLLACLLLAGVQGGPLSSRLCRLSGGECQEEEVPKDGVGGSGGGGGWGASGRGGGGGQLYIDVGPFFKMWGGGGGRGGVDCPEGQPCKGGQGGGGLVIEIGGVRFGGGGWGGGGVRRRESGTTKCETEPCPPKEEGWGGIFGGGRGGFGFSLGGDKNGDGKNGEGGFGFQFGGNKRGWGGGGWGSGGKGGWGGGGGGGGFGWGSDYSSESSSSSSEVVPGAAIRPSDHPSSWEAGNKRGNQAEDLPNEPAETNDVPLTSEELGKLVDQRSD